MVKNSLEEFCIISDYAVGIADKINFLKAKSITESKFWRRILLDHYMRADNMLEMIAGSVAAMTAKEESDLDSVLSKLTTANYYNTVCTFLVIKDDYIHTVELETDNWVFKKQGKKNNRKPKDFGFLPIVDMLAGGIMRDYDYIENLGYDLVFSKIAMMAEQSWS